MRKRLLALLLSALMLLSLAACGSDTQEETSGEETTGEETGTQDFGGAELVVATWGWAEAGLMEGVDGGAFNPNGSANRAMGATVLVRLIGEAEAA